MQGNWVGSHQTFVQVHELKFWSMSVYNKHPASKQSSEIDSLISADIELVVVL